MMAGVFKTKLMSRFKIGQKVVCVNNKIWRRSTDKIDFPEWGPRYGNIVTCNGDDPDWPGSIFLLEWPTSPDRGIICSFVESNFAPLMDITELTSILESVPQTESV
jgi:hypothetical protein